MHGQIGYNSVKAYDDMIMEFSKWIEKIIGEKEDENMNVWTGRKWLRYLKNDDNNYYY